MARDDVTLRRYVDRLFVERAAQFADYRAQNEQFVLQMVTALRDADEKIEQAATAALDRTDQLRGQLEGRVGDLIPRAEVEARIDAALQRMEQQTKLQADRVEAIRTQLERAAYVSRDVFDAALKDDAEHRERVTNQLSVIYGDLSNFKGRQVAFGIALSVGLTVVSITVAILSRVL